VIYRRTYKGNEEWTVFMDRLGYYFEGTLRYNNGLDMQTSLGHRVFEDRDHLGGAYRSVMRLHCMQCVMMALQ
jgi:hypothetical protein